MNFLFVFAGSLMGFFIAIFYGVATVPQGIGLAGPVVLLIDGVIGAALCLLLALWGLKELSREMRKKITDVLLLTSLVPLGWVVYRINTNKSVDDKQLESRPVISVNFSTQLASNGMMNENWLKVSLRDSNMEEVGAVWLLSHNGNSLLVGYNLLS